MISGGGLLAGRTPRECLSSGVFLPVSRAWTRAEWVMVAEWVILHDLQGSDSTSTSVLHSEGTQGRCVALLLRCSCGGRGRGK